MRRTILAGTAGVLVAASLTIAAPAGAHTPSGDADCERGVWAAGTNYESRDTNRLTVSVDGHPQTVLFDRNGELSMPIPQDGRSHTWAWSVSTSNQNPRYSASDSGSITCGEIPPPPPPPVVKKTAVDFKSRDWCNCFHDFARVNYDRDRLKVRKSHPTNTKWVFDLTPRANVKLTGIRHDGRATYRVNRHADGSARVVVRTTNKRCNGHPDGPPAPPNSCRGEGC